MAKRGTLDSTKNEMLAATLGTGKGKSFGCLSTIWQRTAANFPTGRLTRLALVTILRSTGWLEDFDEETWIAAMTNPEHRWLDPLPDGSFYVHDWHDHADDSVHAALYRSLTPFANGRKPKASKVGREEKAELEQQWAQKLEHGGRQDATPQYGGTLPFHSSPFHSSPSPSSSSPPAPAGELVSSDDDEGEGVMKEFPEEIRPEALRLNRVYCDGRFHCPPDYSLRQVRKDVAAIATALLRFPEARERLTAYFAQPPPDRDPDETIYTILDRLGLGKRRRQATDKDAKFLADLKDALA